MDFFCRIIYSFIQRQLAAASISSLANNLANTTDTNNKEFDFNSSQVFILSFYTVLYDHT